MATDITIEASAPRRQAVSFDAFVQAHGDELARAVAVIVNDDRLASTLIDDALETALKRWKQVGFDDEPAHFVYRACSMAWQSTIPPSELEAGKPGIAAPILSAAPDSAVPTRVDCPAGSLPAVVAHFVLDWPVSDVARSLAISPEVASNHVATFLDQIERTQVATTAPGSAELFARRELGARARNANPLVSDAATIRQNSRRKTSRVRLAIGAAVVAGVAIIGSLVANTGTAATFDAPVAEQATSPTAAPAVPPTLGPVSTVAPSAATEQSGDRVELLPGQEPDRSVIVEPPPEVVRDPHLVTIDGQGAFAGARSPAFRNPRRAIFTTSVDGITWEFASRLPLGDYEFIERFERSGDHYVAWIDNALVPNPPNPITIAISPDLVNWTLLTLPVIDVAPDGITLDAVVSDVAASGDDVLLLLSTRPSIDYGALALYESNTCGSTIESDRAVVDLCNEALLDVFSTPDLDSLPPRHRFYLSADGGPLLPVQVPFDSSTDVGLTSVGGRFVVEQANGTPFATSSDATGWQSVVGQGATPRRIATAATDDQGDLVGVGTTQGGPLVLFRVRDGQTTTAAVADVIGIEPTEYQVAISTGPAGWAITIDQLTGESWLLFSADGTKWRELDLPAVALVERNVYVGDDEVLVQSMAGTGPVLTTLPVDPN